MPRNSDNVRYWKYGIGSIGFGLFLVLLGVYFIGKELGWFTSKISIWPVILIVFGAWMILGNLTKRF